MLDIVGERKAIARFLGVAKGDRESIFMPRIMSGFVSSRSTNSSLNPSQNHKTPHYPLQFGMCRIVLIHAISGNPVGAIHELPLLKGLEYFLSNADLVLIVRVLRYPSKTKHARLAILKCPKNLPGEVKISLVKSIHFPQKTPVKSVAKVSLDCQIPH